jgi:rare lipoprotein A (peptidoglycan hydrolase)
MNKAVYIGLLGFLITIPVFAQSQLVQAEGMGSWYETGTGLFASHASLPFGTELIVTNTANGKQVTVQVGGRIPQDRRWIVEISPQAADIIEMNDLGFTMVRIEEVPKVAVKKSMRITSVRDFQQRGRATILAAGTELTAGHPSLNMGRQVQITNQANNRTVVATVRSRVRASQERIIEVSRAVAQALGVSRGTYIDVSIESVDK